MWVSRGLYLSNRLVYISQKTQFFFCQGGPMRKFGRLVNGLARVCYSSNCLLNEVFYQSTRQGIGSKFLIGPLQSGRLFMGRGSSFWNGFILTRMSTQFWTHDLWTFGCDCTVHTRSILVILNSRTPWYVPCATQFTQLVPKGLHRYTKSTLKSAKNLLYSM